MAEHALLSASGSDKWLSCGAALGFEALLEADTGSYYAREGTASHEVLSMSLIQNKEPSSFLGQFITVDKGEETEEIIEVNQDMINAVEITVDYVKRLTTKPGFYEEKVDYSHLAPKGFGTTDIALEVYDKVDINTYVNTLYIIDFKYGAGVRVAAHMNSQLLLYALGALNSLEFAFERDIERVVIVVMQPRVDNIDEYEISIDDLLAWGEQVKPKAILANDLYLKAVASGRAPDAKYFNPTKKGCQWCQGRRLKKCKAHAKLGYSAALEGFDDLTIEKQADLPAIEVSENTLKDPAFLDSTDLAAIYSNMAMFLSFGKDLDEEIATRVQGGESIPGLRIVETENPRSWKGDDDAAIAAMRTAGLVKGDYLKIGIVSPTEAEIKLTIARPKDYKRRYRKLAAAAIHRLPGKPKIIIDKTKPVEVEDDLLG